MSEHDVEALAAVLSGAEPQYVHLAVKNHMRQAERILASDWLARRDAAQRADEREQWAAWLEGWLGAVGPERPTVEAVIAWLRADWRPFGVRAGTAGGSDA